MPPRKKIVKKTVKATRKTPTEASPSPSVTESSDATPLEVNSITTGADGQSAAPEGSPAAQIKLPEASKDKPQIDTPSIGSGKETAPDVSGVMETDQEDPAAGEIPMATDSGKTLAPEKSPSQDHSPTETDSSAAVAVTDTSAGDVTSAQAAPDAKTTDSKAGIPPRKKIVKKIVKVVRKVPAKKASLTGQSTSPNKSTAAPIQPPRGGDIEAITADEDKPETDVNKEVLPDITVTAATNLEAPPADATPMVIDTNEASVPEDSPPIISQESISTNGLCLGEAAANIGADDTNAPLAAPETTPDPKPAGKGKKIVVRKVKKVVKSSKSPAPGKSPDVSSVKSYATPEALQHLDVHEGSAADEIPASSSQHPSSMDAPILDAAVVDTPKAPCTTPSAVPESEPSLKVFGTGKKVVVRKVKKVVKRVVKVVKKGGEVKKVEEEGAGLINGNTKQENVALGNSGSSDMDATMSLRQLRKKTEVFVGGLDRDATEDDIREVFGKAGEIVEVRLMMDGNTGRNKGYAFVRYATATQAKRAVSEFAKVEVCGKVCATAALEGDDRIFLGNIDKKWKKEDIVKLLEQMGIRNIDALTLPSDPSNVSLNRGFAFLELESNRDAQIAYKTLQKKNAFGKGMNVKIAWADPLNEPDEEEMQKVKSVFVEGIPSSWTEEKLKQCFEKYGEIERTVLACNMPSAKRKDFAFVNYTTREAAMRCMDSFVKEELIENGSKINIKVSLAKPVSKGKKSKGDTKYASHGTSKKTANAFQRNTKPNTVVGKGPNGKGSQVNVSGAKPSTTVELLHVLREQATWKHGSMVPVGGASGHGYSHATAGVKRQASAMESSSYPDPRSYPRPRLDGAYPFVNPSMVPSGVMNTSLPYHQRPNVAYGPGGLYGGSDGQKNTQSNYNALPYGKHHSLY